MQPASSQEPPLRAFLGVFVSLAGVSAALTLLFLGMRAVMEIGGVCAEGGPYVPRQPCPEGVPLVMIGGIWGGLIFTGLYVWQCVRHDVPSLAGLLWPALFLSLGWNFLEFGLNPPDSSGLVWGWLVCAVVFFLMGGFPLLLVVPLIWRKARGTAAPSTVGFRELLVPPMISAAARLRSRAATTGATVSPPSDQPDDIVSALAKLDELHSSGALDDAEFEAAKERVLGLRDRY